MTTRKPRRPKMVVVSGVPYTVEYDNELIDMQRPDALGVSRLARQQIILRADMTPDTEAQTLLHEVLHQVIRQSGVQFDDDLEEKFVSAMECGLLQTLRANPDMLWYFQSSTLRAAA